ncbi:hypothetical protein BDZ45DRAFT_314357 [Acephala macrosclerotiorum]|nr:hypothetical protein BDZ45DRAFT_314357 [Acephala macrosclerotiorum]
MTCFRVLTCDLSHPTSCLRTYQQTDDPNTYAQNWPCQRCYTINVPAPHVPLLDDFPTRFEYASYWPQYQEWASLTDAVREARCASQSSNHKCNLPSRGSFHHPPRPSNSRNYKHTIAFAKSQFVRLRHASLIVSFAANTIFHTRMDVPGDEHMGGHLVRGGVTI